MRHNVVMFSGGAGSWAAAQRVVMAKVIEKREKHLERMVARHTCGKCGSTVEYDRRTDLRSEQREGDYVVCPVCTAWIPAKVVWP